MLYKFTRENYGVYAYNVPSEHYFRNQKKKKKFDRKTRGKKKNPILSRLRRWCRPGVVPVMWKGDTLKTMSSAAGLVVNVFGGGYSRGGLLKTYFISRREDRISV